MVQLILPRAVFDCGRSGRKVDIAACCVKALGKRPLTYNHAQRYDRRHKHGDFSTRDTPVQGASTIGVSVPPMRMSIWSVAPPPRGEMATPTYDPGAPPSTTRESGARPRHRAPWGAFDRKCRRSLAAASARAAPLLPAAATRTPPAAHPRPELITSYRAPLIRCWEMPRRRARFTNALASRAGGRRRRGRLEKKLATQYGQVGRCGYRKSVRDRE